MKRSIGFLILLIIFIITVFAYETFNCSVTNDLTLADLISMVSETTTGLYWATILTVVFYGIDLAGLAHLQRNKPTVWYIFGTWILVATMNAIVIWWAVVITLSTDISDIGLLMVCITLLGGMIRFLIIRYHLHE